MTEMLKVMLKEILHIEMGQSPKAENVNIDGRGMPLLNGPAEFTNTNPIPVQFTTKGSRFAEEGEILFCVRGSTTGRMNIADQKYAIGRGLAAISHKNGPEFNSFVKGLIESHLSGLLGGTMGSVFPNINKDQLFNYKCYVPNLNSQQKIAKVLSDLDTKIELNNKINAELEAMAKLIYDYWFVQFDFPDNNGKPYKSSGGKMVYNEELKREIPEGWEVKELGSNIEIFDSLRIPLSSRDRENRKGKYPYFGATSIMDYVDDFIFDDEYILIAEDGSVMDDKGFPIVQFIWGKTWVNNHAHVIQAKNKSQNEFYFQLIKMIPVVLIKTGSIQMKINQENLKKYKVLIPKKELIDSFSEKANSMRRSLINNIEQNQKLAELRDWLLPMLMNGQVKVA